MSEVSFTGQSSLAVFAALNAISEDGILIIDRNYNVLRANDDALRFLGQRILARPITNYIRHPDLLLCIDATLASGEMRAFTFQRNEPARRLFNVKVVGLENSSVLITLTDMTKSHIVEKIQTDFVANVSHELRSPLTAIIGFIETLQDNLASDPDIGAAFLPLMRDEAGRMQRLIDELLTLSRIEADEHVPPREPVSIASVITRAVTLFAKRTEALNRPIRTEIEVGCDFSAINVRGDEDGLLQVFSNLIENALNYGYPDTPILIRCHSPPPQGVLPARVVIAVSNAGDGIEPIHLGRVTERFYRIDKSRSRKVGGSGLGLAIVKHIIGWHQGRLTISSTQGEETVFSVTLPIATGV